MKCVESDSTFGGATPHPPYSPKLGVDNIFWGGQPPTLHEAAPAVLGGFAAGVLLPPLAAHGDLLHLLLRGSFPERLGRKLRPRFGGTGEMWGSWSLDFGWSKV